MRGPFCYVETPALRRLLDDIAAGKVHVVVVYKVDRLTRSLGDFAKLVEVFESHGVSFVSVTQQFNTTTSMGRRRAEVAPSVRATRWEREQRILQPYPGTGPRTPTGTGE